MLLNFCDPRLRPEVSCSTVSTEGYEITNLTTASSRGFLAYSCIKPPINIDLTFICGIEISHVLVWPNVGAQKSSGFQLSASLTDVSALPHTVLSTGYLDRSDTGVLFYRRDVDQSKISTPPGFLRRYIKVTNRKLVDNVGGLRLSIFKTENSVPAVGRLEVWGRVSRCCGRDTAAGIYTLWKKDREEHRSVPREQRSSDTRAGDGDKIGGNIETVLQVPEDFLDPITYEIMIQPITLPSGKVIDHSTLEKHEQNEALWGRTPSDPFTSIPFSNTRRPVTASALKARIDKYLLENSNSEEIKKIPRTLSHKMKPSLLQNRLLEISEIVSENNEAKNQSKFVQIKSNRTLEMSCPKQRKQNQHRLPAIAMCCKRRADSKILEPLKIKKTVRLSESESDGYAEKCKESVHTEIDSNLELNIKTVLSGLKRFSEPKACSVTEISNKCTCCSSRTLYQLPCNHVVCRKVLTSTKNLACGSCGLSYKTSDPKRVYE